MSARYNLARSLLFRIGPSALLLIAGLSAPRHSQAIALNSVIGPAGTNAISVRGLGNPVNHSGAASASVATTLTAAGSPSPSTFNFNTGFPDTLDRAHASAGAAGAVFADRKFDSATATALILDKNNNANFGDETDSAPGDPNTFHLGFGMHSDNFITYDLEVIRANAGLAGKPFILTGQAGVAGRLDANLTSGAIILDSQLLAVFDWNSNAGGSYDAFDTFSTFIAPNARYLTFIGLSGLDGSNNAAHIGFADVQLIPVPEPSTFALLGLGLAPLVRRGRWRRFTSAAIG